MVLGSENEPILTSYNDSIVVWINGVKKTVITRKYIEKTFEQAVEKGELKLGQSMHIVENFASKNKLHNI